MKRESYSLDDLHQLALAECENDPHAERLLSDVYDSLRREYLDVLDELRERMR